MIRCAECSDALGGYALGALDADEAEAVAAHLATCAECAVEHARLASLPGLLDLVGSAEARVERPQASLEQAVLLEYTRTRPESDRGRRAGRLRRRARPVLAGALAGAALTAAVFVLLARGGGGPDEVRLAGSPLAPAASATLELDAGDAGTAVRLRARGLAPTRGDEVYELWFVHRAGRVSAGTFRVSAAGQVDVRLATAARPGAYDRIGVTREPDDADPARNGPNVLAGRLSG